MGIAVRYEELARGAYNMYSSGYDVMAGKIGVIFGMSICNFSPDTIFLANCHDCPVQGGSQNGGNQAPGCSDWPVDTDFNPVCTYFRFDGFKGDLSSASSYGNDPELGSANCRIWENDGGIDKDKLSLVSVTRHCWHNRLCSRGFCCRFSEDIIEWQGRDHIADLGSNRYLAFFLKKKAGANDDDINEDRRYTASPNYLPDELKKLEEIINYDTYVSTVSKNLSSVTLVDNSSECRIQVPFIDLSIGSGTSINRCVTAVTGAWGYMAI